MKLKVVLLAGAGVVLFLGAQSVNASDGEVRAAVSNNAVRLKVDGDRDDDWWVESSTNLTTWTTQANNLVATGTNLTYSTNLNDPQRFFRIYRQP